MLGTAVKIPHCSVHDQEGTQQRSINRESIVFGLAHGSLVTTVSKNLNLQRVHLVLQALQVGTAFPYHYLG